MKQQEEQTILTITIDRSNPQSINDTLLQQFLEQNQKFFSENKCTAWEEVFVIASAEFAKDNATLWGKIFDCIECNNNDREQDIKNKDEIQAKIISYLQNNWKGLTDKQKEHFKKIKCKIEATSHPIICSGDVDWVGSDSKTKTEITFYRKPIGSGTSGNVFAIYPFLDDHNNIVEPMAGKFLLPEHCDSDDFLKKMKVEYTNMQQLKDYPNCVQVKGWVSVGNKNQDQGILMQLIKGPSLKEYFGINKFQKNARKENLSILEKRIAWFEQIVAIIDSIHKKGYVYGDLALQNIMILFEENNICLVDFGSLKKIGEKYSICGHIGFIAPESNSRDYKVATSLDVYALGAMLYTFFLGYSHGGTISDGSDIKKSFKEAREEYKLPKKVMKNVAELIVKYFDEKPEKRPEIAKIKEDIKKIKEGIKKAITDNDNNRFISNCFGFYNKSKKNDGRDLLLGCLGGSKRSYIH